MFNIIMSKSAAIVQTLLSVSLSHTDKFGEKNKYHVAIYTVLSTIDGYSLFKIN